MPTPGQPMPTLSDPCAGCRCCDEAAGKCFAVPKKALTGKCCDQEEWSYYCPGEEPEECEPDPTCNDCDEKDPKNDACHVCDGGVWKLRNAGKQNACGAVCCGVEGCNHLGTGCKMTCADEPNVCQYCDDADGTLKYTDDTGVKITPCGGECCGTEGCNSAGTDCKVACTSAPNACQYCNDSNGLLEYFDATKTNVCGEKCCGSEGCNSDGTDCRGACTGESNGCQMCDADGNWVADSDLNGASCGDDCHICSNGSCEKMAGCCLNNSDCKSCQECNGMTCALKSGYSLTDDGECCLTENIYTKGGKKQCCTLTADDCHGNETFDKDTCSCKCEENSGCCPKGQELCYKKCCAVGAVCNTNTKSCCQAGEKILNGYCCPTGTKYTSSSKGNTINYSYCCALDAIGVFKDPDQGTGYNKCCPANGVKMTYSSTDWCCPAGTTGWAYNESYGSRCCKGKVIDGYCCPENSNVQCGGMCCSSTVVACNIDKDGARYCCSAGSFE